MKKLLMAGLVASALAAPTVTFAQAAAPYSVAYNVGLVSDYYFRGITQTWGSPAVQGGIDLTTPGGWYLGTWLSQVSDKQYAGGSSLEVDYYGGYNGKFNSDWGWTAGLYGYYYPGANTKKGVGATGSQSYNTLEWNAGVSWKWVSLKYSQTITNAFGVSPAASGGYTTKSDGSTYLDLTATYPLNDKWSLVGHLGKTDIKSKATAATAGGSVDPDYNDYKLGVTYAYTDALSFGLAAVKASNSAYYNKTASVKSATDLKDLGKSKVIASVLYTF